MTRDDAPYLSDRSFVEAIRAIQADHPAAAAVHQELCLLYTGRVLAQLREFDPLAWERHRPDPALLDRTLDRRRAIRPPAA